MGLGVFLGNGIAQVFGSDKQIASVKFDFERRADHDRGRRVPAARRSRGPARPGRRQPRRLAYWSNTTWEEGGKTWKGVEDTVDPGRGYAHETGHMLSNAFFGFWQGVVNGIENVTTDNHDDRFFERVGRATSRPATAIPAIR